MLYPINGGPLRPLWQTCAGGNDVERISALGVSWSADGKFLYLNFQDSLHGIPAQPGQMLPPIPAAGFKSKEDVAAIPVCG
jgi:hypothetical protein